MKTTSKTIALLISTCVGMSISVALAGSGWTSTVGGSQQFLDPANWNDGDVNGIFPADWTCPDAALSLRLTNDWSGTLTFLGNIAKDTTFYGRKDNDSGAQNRTITLDGDILVQPSASAGKLVFDATVGLDLGGETRTFLCYSPSSADKFRVSGSVSNGNLVFGGNGAGMTLVGNAAIAGNVEVRPNTTLVVNWATAGSTVRRAEDVELRRATLAVSAYKGNDTAEFGALTVSGRDAPGVSVLTITPGNYVATVHADSLSVTNGGTLVVMATALADDAATSSRLVFAAAPALAGDAGTAGTPGVAVLPGVILGTAANALPTGTINNNENYNGLFLATYDASFGVRRLAAGETSTAVSPDAAVNLVVNTGDPLVLDSDATVNSLQLQATNYRNAVPSISGDGKLTVKSGMVLATVVKSGATIGVALDFGETTGRIVAAGPTGEQVALSKPVYGSGGLVLSKGLTTAFDTTVAPSSSGRGFEISTTADAGTYTGDTWIQSIVALGSSPFLPHGTRSGDTIVNGCLSFGTISINGLYGTGAVRGTTLTVGEDGSDSCFEGTGYLTSALNIAGGTFDLEGTIAQGAVNVAANAAIGGAGGITNNLAFAEGAKLAVNVVDGVASCLNVAGAVSGVAVTVNAAVEGGKWKAAQCILKSDNAIAATFVKGDGVGSLELRNNGAELWASPKVSGLTIVLR